MHTLVSLSAVGHHPAPGFKSKPGSIRRRGLLPLFRLSVENTFFQLKAICCSSGGKNKVIGAGTEWLLLSLWLVIYADMSKSALWLYQGLIQPPRRLAAMSFIQFRWLPTGNEGFGGHWWGEAKSHGVGHGACTHPADGKRSKLQLQ